MSFISELERLKENASNGIIGKRDVGNYLVNHAEAIRDLVEVAENVKRSCLLTVRPPLELLNKLSDALANLNKEKP